MAFRSAPCQRFGRNGGGFRDAERRATLPAGSYLALARAKGREDQRDPFLVQAGGSQECAISLLPEGTTPPGFVYIPPGTFRYQGDPLVGFPLRGRVVRTEGFFLSRDEITFEEYLTFLNDASLDRKDRRRAAPTNPTNGRFICSDSEDGPWNVPSRMALRSPVVGLDRSGAAAYVAWRNRDAPSGWCYRLPSPEEWEKAARGVDGRIFPWGGSEFDYSLAESYFAVDRGDGARLNLLPVGSFPEDESPYGIRGMAGGATEYCTGSIAPQIKGWDMLRGGSWASHEPLYFHATSRVFNRTAVPSRGFRIVAERTGGSFVIGGGFE